MMKMMKVPKDADWLDSRRAFMLLLMLTPPPPRLPQVEDEAEPGLLFPDDVRSVQRNVLRPGEDGNTTWSHVTIQREVTRSRKRHLAPF